MVYIFLFKLKWRSYDNVFNILWFHISYRNHHFFGDTSMGQSLKIIICLQIIIWWSMKGLKLISGTIKCSIINRLMVGLGVGGWVWGLISRSVVFPEDLIIQENWQYLNRNEHIFVPLQVPLRTFDLTEMWCRTSKTSSETVGFFLWNTAYFDQAQKTSFTAIWGQFSFK